MKIVLVYSVGLDTSALLKLYKMKFPFHRENK